MRYKAPSTEDLARLKEQLGYTGSRMAALFGVSDDNQFRKYTGGKEPRKVNAQMLFFAMARLVLKQKDIETVLEKMREVGADIDLDAPSTSRASTGEPE
jgi:hypothetical protein